MNDGSTARWVNARDAQMGVFPFPDTTSWTGGLARNGQGWLKSGSIDRQFYSSPMECMGFGRFLLVAARYSERSIL